MALLRELIQPAQLERCGDRSFPVLSMTMHDGIMLQSDRFKKSLASVDQSAYKVVRRNQLVVGFPIDEGVLYIQQVVDAGIMSPAYDVWNVDETKVNLRYFELCLHSPQSMMFYKTNLRGTTARRRSLPKDTLLSLPVPVPSMERQCEIASTLDRLQALIRLRQHQLCALDQLIKARFVEMFGEETKHGVPLKECCIDVRGGGTPSMQHPEYYGGNVPFIKSGDVRGDMVSSGALWLTEKALEETTAKYVPQGSVLVVNRSAALLREFRAAIAARPVVINQDIKAFIPKHDYTSEYLLWAIKIQTQLLLTKVTTVLTSHIDLKDLLELRIANASIELQKEFSAFISQVDKSKLSPSQSLQIG